MQPLEWADVVALLRGVPRRPAVRVIPAAGLGLGSYHVDHACAYPEPVNGLTWVKRNEDKPHRCPCCHAVSIRAKRGYGPRTRAVCARGCGIRWRVGVRGYRWRRL